VSTRRHGKVLPPTADMERGEWTLRPGLGSYFGILGFGRQQRLKAAGALYEVAVDEINAKDNAGVKCAPYGMRLNRALVV
jgi:hypothetical protein